MQLVSLMVRSRKHCLWITIAALVHFGLMSLALPSWRCPIRYGLGVPCPGCGLSRATLELLQGHFDHALRIHAFSPIVVGVAGLILIAIVLPKSPRYKLAECIARFEDRTGITIGVLSSFLGYWLVRLCFFTKEFYQFVM